MPESDDDRKAFAEATRGARRLKPRNQARLEKPRPKPKARQTRAARAAILEASLDGTVASAGGDDIAFRRDSVAQRTFSRLRRGEFAIEAEIDLHGMRLTEAQTELKAFLAECAARRLGCVRVIHGKGARSGPGGPILKPGVHHWLTRFDQVLAFVSAQPRHGGGGAVYVLLRQGP
jgi:DNA-nicking Smr family endonuclease